MSKSKLARVLTVGTMLAATILASTTAVAYGDERSAVGQDGRRPPTEQQVGEAWHHRPAAADQQTVTSTSQTRRAPTEGQVGEPWHPRVSVPARPPEPRGRPSWPAVLLAASAATVLLLASVAMLAGRKPRVGQVA